jgi:organic radical activating enzyme
LSAVLVEQQDHARTGVTGAPANKLTRLSVEYGLTEHCNISCHACAHASPLLAKKFANVVDFVRDFEALAEVFHSRELRIVGGEPLLHPELLAFLREGRRIGIADTIVVYTNGVLLHRMPDDFWRLIDKLHVSVYPGVRRRLDDEDCARLCRTHDVELGIEQFRTFDQTLIGKRIDDHRLVKAIYRACHTATECHTVHGGRFYKCPMATLMSSWLALHGTRFESPATDGVALHGNPALQHDLERYLGSAAPLAACSYCLGSSGPAVTHRQLDKTGCSAWLEEDGQALIDDVARRLLPPSGLRSTLRGVKELLKGRP